MEDTDFWVPEKKRERLAKVYMTREVNQTKVGQTKEKEAIQENSKVEQRKSKLEREYLEEYNGNNLGILISMDQKPHFESGGAGLVSTIDDYSRFAQMLMNKGRFKNTCILASKTVEYMTTCQLNPTLDKDVAMWDSLRGHSYGNLMRIMTHPELAVFNGSKGEYGWDGWLGPYMANDPTNEITFLMMQQKTDTGTTSYTRKLRNIVSASIE